MTDPVITMEPAEVSVQPGAQQRVEVTVRNSGSLVEDYRLEVLDDTTGGGPAAWAQVVPETVQVYPGETGSAVVVFAAPEGGEATTGRFGIAVRAVSTVSADSSAVAEGELEVGQVFGLQATIVPATSSGRWRGHHVVRYANWGNAPVHLRLQARDPDERLGFLLTPGEINVPLGGSATARLTVRTRKPFLRGTLTRLPFEVVGEPDEPRPFGRPEPSVPGDPRRPVLAAAFTQKPIVGRTTVAIAALVIAALVGAVVLALKRPAGTPTIPLSLGVPLPPHGVHARALHSGQIQVSWRPVQDVLGYRVITLQGATGIGVAPVPAEQQSFETPRLTPSTRYCFQIESVRGAKRLSRRSAPVCRTTVSASTSGGGGSTSSSPSSPSPTSPAPTSPTPTSPTPTSPTPTSPTPTSPTPTSSSGGPPIVSFTKGEWILLVGGPTYYKTRAGERQAHQQVLQQAADINIHEGVPVSVLNSADYPNMLVGANTPQEQFWAPYLRGFASQLEAAQYELQCENVFHETCVGAQPNP